MFKMANKASNDRGIKPVMMRRRGKIQKKWTEDENRKILDYLVETKSKGLAIEKPSARLYYERLIEKKGLFDRSHDLVRNKVRNFQVKYKEALRWHDENGKSIAECEGDSKFLVTFMNRYPHFQYYKDIWGDIANTAVPCETDVSQIENVETVDYVFEEDGEDHHYNPVIMEPAECYVTLETPSSHLSSDSETAVSGGISMTSLHRSSMRNRQKRTYVNPGRPSCVGASKVREEGVKEMFRLLHRQLEFDQHKCATEASQFEKDLAERRAERRADRELERELKNKELDIRQEENRMKAEVRKMELEVEKLKWETQMEMVKRNMQPFNNQTDN